MRCNLLFICIIIKIIPKSRDIKGANKSHQRRTASGWFGLLSISCVLFYAERFNHPVPTAVAIGQPSAVAAHATTQRKSHIGTDRANGVDLSASVGHTQSPPTNCNIEMHTKSTETTKQPAS